VILALVDDLMVGLRIEDAAKAVGKIGETVSTGEDADQSLRSGAVEGLVVDLAMTQLDLDDLVRAAGEAGAWSIAFYPHVQIELRRKAEMAGVDRTYPRSRFLRDLPKLLLERLDKKA